MVETIGPGPRCAAASSMRPTRSSGSTGSPARRRGRSRGRRLAEGSIYVHFEDKIDLVIAVIVEREPYFAELLELPSKAGGETVEANLAPWAEELLKLLLDNQPIFYALMGDRSVFARFKERLRERRPAPSPSSRTASSYVGAEQELGRIDARVVPDVVASILIGACRDQVHHALAKTGGSRDR